MSTTHRRPARPPVVPDADLAAIRKSIERHREAAGLSPEGLSEEAGLSRAAVRLIESGRSSPSLGTLYLLARVLGCRVADLAPGPEQPAPDRPQKKPKKS